ncbi:growth factor receptor-bound protein 2-like isoform X1 [Lytechinus variegatus]|uniref:growth factor receptor-bound protein 2-like isoform X1 n=2 Tax=Lytechinus variegatus TaxID=7654 RepID=UPI001BB1E07D|nr:growth factor receptor-bound protein 2-like isoform X1 [Lytechinus variegatus]
MEAIALHDFTAGAEDELSFKKGNVLKLMEETKGAQNWLKAEMDGRDGLVPLNYVQPKDHFWYVGKLKRNMAEEYLAIMPNDGAFLIRESESTPGDFSLSVKHKNNVQHFKVLRDGSGKYFLWVVKFNSLNQLVDYHRTSSVSRTQTIYLKDPPITIDTSKTPDELRMQLAPTVKYKALWDFEAMEEGELSFKKNDTIHLIEKDGSDWWQGKIVTETGTRQGLFPATYVEEIQP